MKMISKQDIKIVDFDNSTILLWKNVSHFVSYNNISTSNIYDKMLEYVQAIASYFQDRLNVL